MQKEINAKALLRKRANAGTEDRAARLNTVDVTCARLGVGRTMVYKAMHADPKYRRGLPLLRSVTIGGRRLVSDAAIEEFIAALEAQQAA